MKTLFKPLIVLAVTAIAFSSCMKDTSAEDEAAQRELEQKILAQFEADAEEIEEFISLSENPSEWEKDDTDFAFPTIGKTIKRGFWFEVLVDPIPEEGEEEYEYKLNQNSTSNLPVALPEVKVTYSVSSLDGEVYQSGEEKLIDLATFVSNTEVFNATWYYSFIPKAIEYNEQDYEVGGLTTKGLRKGSKIRVLAPSYFAFGENTNGEIPANSPLLYEFDVLDITE